MIPNGIVAAAVAKTRATLVRMGARLEEVERRADGATAAVAIGAVMLVAAALFLVRLGAAELCSTNEAVEGLAVQQMMEHGELLAPVLNGHAPMFKPPLFHWTAAAIARVLGMHQATEFAVRLPSVAFALAGVLLTMLFVRSWLGLANGLLAGLVLLASHQYVTAARFGRVDMALTFCESLALFAVLWWLGRGGARGGEHAAGSRYTRAAPYLFAVALALGVLAKGPIGALLPLAAVAAALVSDRRCADVRALAAPGPIVVLLAIGSCWYLACLATGRLDVLRLQIVDENINRFVGGIRTMSPLYYLKPLLLNSVPLSLFVPIAVIRALRVRQSGDELGGGARHDLRPYLLAMFWAATVVFFSIAAYKRRAYLLPLWPSAAALLVWWVSSWNGDDERRLARGTLAAVCGAMLLFNLWHVPYAERSECGAAGYRTAAAAINGAVLRREPLYLDASSPESASLLFYLGRTVPVLADTLEKPPRGYVLVPEGAWAARPPSVALRPLLAVTLERQRLVLAEPATMRRARGDAQRITRTDDVRAR